MIVCVECESWKPAEGKCMRGIFGASPSFTCQLGKARKPERREQSPDMDGQALLFGR
jgi:hypothetical protein